MGLGSGRDRPLNLDGDGKQEALPNGNARFPLSVAATGVPIAIGTTSTEIHTSQIRSQDEIYLWAANSGGADATLTLGFGDSDFTSDTSKFTVPVTANTGLSMICPGLPVRGITIYAQASAADSINLFGFIIRYFPRDSIQAQPEQRSGFDGTM